MRRFARITAWVLGGFLTLIALFVGHANYRISHDETRAGGPKSFVGLVCGWKPDCEATPVTYIRDSTETLRAMIRTSRTTTGIADLQADLKSVRAKTLVLWGALDQLVPLANGERLARELPDARLGVVEDGWHGPWLEQPKVTARAILAFLDEP